MNNGSLTIYNASAGSGKTYVLTGLYLTSLFRSKYNYRKILAVTFTNKATSEMKSRILDNLHNLATGSKSDYLESLVKTTGKTEENIRLEAQEILFSILHDFSRFSVTTIDAFFQKIIRAFAREAGINSGFNIELDHSLILSEAIDKMIASASEDRKLKEWLLEYVMSNLDEEKSWNLKGGIIKLAEELFNEKFKILSQDEILKLEDKEFLLDYIRKIRNICTTFETSLLNLGKKCEKIFIDHGLNNEMFYYKGLGIPGHIKNLASGQIRNPNKYVRSITNDPPKWCTGKMSCELQNAISAGLDEILVETISFYDRNILSYNSANVILSDIYALGILSDVLKKVHEITTSENRFLLSDAGELLSLITREDQAPFIYEKTGNRYENFMIDEFQDTSIMQWNNFNPLITNSMSEGFDNVIVGDIKQSIYRWRNSDWKILDLMKDLVDNERFLSEPLKVNWRSSSNIITFNNALFSVIPEQLDLEFKPEKPELSFLRLFSEAVQDDPGKKDGGYVRLEFIDDDVDADEKSGGGNKQILKEWKCKILEKLPGVIELFQDNGYRASDIGILVRDGREGSAVIKTLIDYGNVCPAEKKGKYNYSVISSDSLLLSRSHAINLIIAVISLLNNKEDIISRAQMLRCYLLATGSPEAAKASLKRDDLLKGMNGYLPEGYEKFLESIAHLPLFEVTESIISFFGLGKFAWNVAYLNTFQDSVVNFTSDRNQGFQSFLEWWDTKGKNKSVVLPESQDAAKVFTIHKAKGLEFPVVILPFLSWNLDHKNSHQPYLWITPDRAPFNDLGIVPVRYRSCLTETIFSEQYLNERFSSYLDNVNLLYVAMTRAKEAIYGFSPGSGSRNNGISALLKNAFASNPISDNPHFNLSEYFNAETGIFEFGKIKGTDGLEIVKNEITSSEYQVTHGVKSLKLKLHAESYFSRESFEKLEKINYGKMMHEVFESIKSSADISKAIRKLVLEGKIPQDESTGLERKIHTLISSPPASDWFHPDNTILTEAEILIPLGNIRRPDRIIFRDDKTIIIDFKFGEENPQFRNQIRYYASLLNQMGYPVVEGFIWYVDKNKIVPVND